MDRTTWRKEFEKAEVDPSKLIFTPTDLDLDLEFDPGYGSSEGASFTAWSADRVFFPVVYDGSEWIESVPRNPSLEAPLHFGGQ